jgi:transcriptional regulator with XRE-family HTH domain
MSKTLQDAVADYLTGQRLSNKALAEDTGVSYPTILAIVKRGTVPRKASHREALRKAMGISTEEWGLLLANSGRDGLVVPDSGPLNLQQLVAKRLYARGYTEQSFADATDIPYATISGITRKGAIPRRETLKKIAETLGIDDSTVNAAVTVSRTTRGDSGSGIMRAVVIPSFVDMFSRHLAESGVTMGEFAKQHDLGYLTLSRLVTHGLLPEDGGHILQLLCEVLHVDGSVLEAAIRRDREGDDHGSIALRSHHPIPSDANPLQKALIGLMNREGLTIKAMSQQCDLSQLTMAKFIKGESVPSRTGTHKKLQGLLGLDKNAYMALISPQADVHLQQSNAAMMAMLETEREAQRLEAAQESFGDLQEFVDLIRKLSEQQRHALRHFMHSLIGMNDDSTDDDER